MIKRIFLYIFLIINTLAIGQKKAESIHSKDIDNLVNLEKTIAETAKTVVTDTFPEQRAKANTELLGLMKKLLGTPNSFNYAFTKIEHIAIIESEDKEFRLFTWGLSDANFVNKHYGFIQLNRSRPTFYELKDNTKSIKRPENELLTTDKWYGALYYNTKKFKSKDGERYLIFGLNFGDTVERAKVCDVLTIKGGMPRFGAPVFEKEEKGKGKEKDKKRTQHRLVLTHSIDASIRLNFDGFENKIIYDHLENIPTNHTASGYVAVPDGTYEAFELKKGVWQHVEKLAIREMDEAPRPKPVLGTKVKVINRDDAKIFQWPDELKKKQEGDDN
jgi:hypothetical protein